MGTYIKSFLSRTFYDIQGCRKFTHRVPCLEDFDLLVFNLIDIWLLKNLIQTPILTQELLLLKIFHSEI